MQEHDLRILRGAAVPTAAVAVPLVVVAGLLAGGKGALGATLGVAVVAVFFTVGVVVLGWAAKINPVALMNVAIATYVVKAFALLLVLAALGDTTLFDRRAFGLSILVAAVVWMAGEVRAFSNLKILYVEPDRGS
jgi:ATP synthase protein I